MPSTAWPVDAHGRASSFYAFGSLSRTTFRYASAPCTTTCAADLDVYRGGVHLPLNQVEARSSLHDATDLARLQRKRRILKLPLHVAPLEEAPVVES